MARIYEWIGTDCLNIRNDSNAPSGTHALPGHKKKRESKRIVMSAGFEPARVAPLACTIPFAVPEASALDHSARTPYYGDDASWVVGQSRVQSYWADGKVFGHGSQCVKIDDG
jgi:hypothetical protein